MDSRVVRTSRSRARSRGRSSSKGRARSQSSYAPKQVQFYEQPKPKQQKPKPKRKTKDKTMIIPLTMMRGVDSEGVLITSDKFSEANREATKHNFMLEIVAMSPGLSPIITIRVEFPTKENDYAVAYRKPTSLLTEDTGKLGELAKNMIEAMGIKSGVVCPTLDKVDKKVKAPAFKTETSESTA